MIYPTAPNNQDFLKYWKIDQVFGNPTNYGVHDGLDINKIAGGNTDLGQPLYAVADGKIVYYHNESHPTTGFGRHMVLECETVRGKRWYHYAHCQEITNSTDVKEGDVIGKLGKSGTTFAHLHFAVFQVDPKTLYKGIDSIAKNITELKTSWEDFELLTTMQSNLQELFGVKTIEELKTVWDREMGFLKSEREKVGKLETQLKGSQEQIERLKADNVESNTQSELRKKEIQKFIEDLAKRLALPAASDQTDILSGVDRLLEVEEQLRIANKKIVQEEKEYSLEKTDMLQKIDELRIELQQQQKENELLAGRLLELENRLNSNTTAANTTNQWKTFINILINIFKKGRK